MANPQRELDRLEGILGSEERPPLWTICGASRWFRDRALARLREALGQDAALVELDGNDSGGDQGRVAEFLMDLRTADLFRTRKALFLRGGDKWLKAHGKLLAECLTKMASGNSLVIEVTRLDGRTTLARRLKRQGVWFEFRRLYDKPFRASEPPWTAELVRWVGERARARGVEMDAEAAWFVVQVVGSEAAKLEAELERIGPALRGDVATPELLRPLLTISFDSTQFELVDALLAGDRKLAWRALVALSREGLRDRDGKPMDPGAVFPMVSSWLLANVAKLIEARAEVDNGGSIQEAAARHGGYFRERFEEQLARHDRESLGRVHQAVLRAERRLRLSGEDPAVLLERLAAEILLPERREIAGAAW
ncbi:MAG: DNA polymerase III subunit delta [Planctomycetota bacterium]